LLYQHVLIEFGPSFDPALPCPALPCPALPCPALPSFCIEQKMLPAAVSPLLPQSLTDDNADLKHMLLCGAQGNAASM